MNITQILPIEDLKAQLLNETLEIIRSTKEGVIKGFQYAYNQLPDIIAQFLSWEFYNRLIWVLIGVTLLIIGTVGYLRLAKFVRSTHDRKRDYGGAEFFLGVSFWLIGASIALTHLFQLVKIVVAPKIYLIQWILAQVSEKPWIAR